MMIGNAVNAGMSTIRAAVKSMDDSAWEIAKQTVQPINRASAAAPVGDPSMQTTPSALQQDSLIKPLLEGNMALYQAQAGAKMISVSNNMLGSLLNIFA
jgi:hypothetical protein